MDRIHTDLSSPLTPSIALQLDIPKVSIQSIPKHSSMIVELGSSHSRSMSPDPRIKIDQPAEHRVSSTSDADSEDIIIHHSPLRDHTSLDEDPVISNELKDQPTPYRSPSPPSLPPLTTKNLSTGAWAWALRRASETHGHIGQKRSRSQDSDELGGQEEGRENSAKCSKSTAEFWDRNRNQGRQQARLLEISTIPKIAAVTRQDLPPRSSQPDRPTLQPPRKRSLSPIRPLPLNPNSRQIPIDLTTPKRRPISPITPLLLPHHSTPPPTLQLRHSDLHRRGLSTNPTRYSSVPLSPLFGPRPRIPAAVVRQGSYDARIAEVVARERCRAQAEQARGQARGPGLPAFWRHEDEQQRLIARAAELEAYNDMQRTRERMSGMIGQRMRPVIAVGPVGGKGMNMEIASPTTSQSSGARRRVDDNQLETLMNAFRKSAYPSTAERELLGRQLGMTSRSVQIWFQNRRRAHKVDQQSAIQKAQLEAGSSLSTRRVSPDEVEEIRMIKREWS